MMIGNGSQWVRPLDVLTDRQSAPVAHSAVTIAYLLPKLLAGALRAAPVAALFADEVKLATVQPMRLSVLLSLAILASHGRLK